MNMNIEEIVKEAVQEIFGKALAPSNEAMQTEPGSKPEQLVCVVAVHGWIYIGWMDEKSDRLCLRNARCLIRHRTGKGLGYALSIGPCDKVVIDDGPVNVEIRNESVVMVIEVPENKWAEVCHA